MKKTLRPDIIVMKKDYFFILDAKYYNPIFSDGKDLPGIESISKQYLYELAFRNHLDYQNKIKRNIFLIPWNGEDIIYEGKVSIDFLKKIGDIELQDILLYKLPADKVFELYIKDMRLSDDDYQKLEK